MTSSQNNKINNYIKELNNNFKIELFIEDIDNGDLEILKTSINNINKDNLEKIDIPLEIYRNGFLTPNRLDFIMKNCSDILYISSSLLKILIKKNEIQLLRIIFDNTKFYDNDFIKHLLYQYKYKRSIFVTALNEIMSNDQYVISINQNIKKFQNYFTRVCHEGKENIIKFLIGNGANVNNSNKDRKTPLGCVCEKGKEKNNKIF